MTTSNLSAEGQHLIDALEAHMAAVTKASENGSEELLAEVESAWDVVRDHLEATGAKFRQAAAKQAEVGMHAGSQSAAPSVGAPDFVAGSPAPSAGSEAGGEPAQAGGASADQSHSGTARA